MNYILNIYISTLYSVSMLNTKARLIYPIVFQNYHNNALGEVLRVTLIFLTMLLTPCLLFSLFELSSALFDRNLCSDEIAVNDLVIDLDIESRVPHFLYFLLLNAVSMHFEKNILIFLTFFFYF